MLSLPLCIWYEKWGLIKKLNHPNAFIKHLEENQLQKRKLEIVCSKVFSQFFRNKTVMQKLHDTY